MPEHNTKKKGAALHSTPSSNKIPVIQEDNHSTVSQEKSETVNTIDEVSENALTEEEGTVVAEIEIPKAPKDIMRTEPVLTRLIVDAYEGGLDENGFFEGDGIAHFVGGHWYKGNFKNGFMDGQGVYCWADGIMYAGEFTNNKITGNGVYSWPDGSIYEGEVVDGLRHGKGTYRCGTCPSMYTGEWIHGKRHGKGILYFDEKCETYYDGDWNDGMKHGSGTHKYKSGNIYQGDWFYDKRHGQGKMSWYDRGEEYEGQWVNGIQNGIGRYTWYSKRVAISQYPIRNEYEGEFVNGMRNGYGVFSYASGAKYAGQWKGNVKNGQGEFTFKNGSIFKGMFENDHIVEFPDVIPSRMTTPDITEAGIPVRSQTPVRMPSPAAGLGSVDAVLDISLSEIFIRDKFDIDQQQIELDEVTKTVLRYITPLKHIYKCYSSLGNTESADNTFVMNRIQFWRFLKDCDLHVLGFSLTQMDVACGVNEKTDDLHDPATQFYVKDFVNALVYVGYLIFKEEFQGQKALISKCLVKLIDDKMLPNACIIKGCVFSDAEKTKEAMKYIDHCNGAFVYFSTKNGKTNKFMKMRDFLLILKQLKLLNSNLTARKFIEILHSENLRVLEDRSYNLDTEIVFLEFFETLVDCAQYFSLPAKLESKSSLLSTKHRIQNVLSLDSVKSPTLTKGDEEFPFEGENLTESARSPVDAPSPDKSTTFAAESASVEEQTKEHAQSPTTKAQDAASERNERKTSTASAPKRDTHGSKDGSSVTGSRSKRRGTHGHIETEDKFGSGSATNSNRREKVIKEREKSKNGTKSAKKVVIDDDVATTIAAPSIIDPESEIQSTVPRVFSATDNEGSINQSLPDKATESVTSPGKSQVNSIAAAERGNVITDHMNTMRDQLQQESPVHPISSHEALSPDVTAAEDINEDHFQIWANHLNIFFENHFFPAFERQKLVDKAIAEKHKDKTE